jgi:hypothetical protein
MSVIILGGNNCMVGEYRKLCSEYHCDAKVFIRADGGLKKRMGSPDLVIFFTNTMSHKMVRGAMHELKGQRTRIARAHSSSMNALRGILEQYAVGRSCQTNC